MVRTRDMEDFTIIIPVKLNSVRCPLKNLFLLPETLEYIEKQELLDKTVIIADSNDFMFFASQYKGIKIHLEQREENSDELLSIDNYLNIHPEINKYLWLPAPQPCRDKNLINKVLELGLDNYDMITSYITRPDRSIFKLDEFNKFAIKDTERKGSMCKEERVADGAIYYTTSAFTHQVFQSKNRNYTFWNSNIGFVENDAPLVDIDTTEDLNRFAEFYR